MPYCQHIELDTLGLEIYVIIGGDKRIHNHRGLPLCQYPKNFILVTVYKIMGANKAAHISCGWKWWLSKGSVGGIMIHAEQHGKGRVLDWWTAVGLPWRKMNKNKKIYWVFGENYKYEWEEDSCKLQIFSSTLCVQDLKDSWKLFK